MTSSRGISALNTVNIMSYSNIDTESNVSKSFLWRGLLSLDIHRTMHIIAHK